MSEGFLFTSHAYCVQQQQRGPAGWKWTTQDETKTKSGLTDKNTQDKTKTSNIKLSRLSKKRF